MKILPTDFDGHAIRRVYDEETETWWFSVIDVVQVLTESANARDYWFKMKQRVRQEDGAELSTICRQLKMPAADGKLRLTDVATAQNLLRIVQSIPSPKAEPIKLWLAKVGYERMQEMKKLIMKNGKWIIENLKDRAALSITRQRVWQK